MPIKRLINHSKIKCYCHFLFDSAFPSTMNAIRRSISIVSGWSRRRLPGDQSVPLFFSQFFASPLGWLSYPPALPGAIDIQARRPLTGLCTAEQLHCKLKIPHIACALQNYDKANRCVLPQAIAAAGAAVQTQSVCRQAREL